MARARRSRLRFALLSLLGAAVVGAGFVGDAYAQNFLGGLPPVTGLTPESFNGDTLIYDRAGNLLADEGQEGDHRVVVSIRDISPKILQASVAIEDRNFYRHQGFDLSGLTRAGIGVLSGRTYLGGGSTITQQLAKQLFLSPEQSINRKVKELVLSYQLTQNYSKDQILELYLNESYYGSQSYGVEAAAQTYFHKHAKDVSLSEAAMLAGLPQAPSQYSPHLHPQAAKARQKEVLEAMVKAGFVAQADADRAAAEPVNVYPVEHKRSQSVFVQEVLAELDSLNVRRGNRVLSVTTTLDPNRQAIAERVVRENLKANLGRDPKGAAKGELESALVSIDPKTGQVVAYVPNSNPSGPKGQEDLPNTPRNPGSSVKIFTYAAAINARRATMETQIVDGPSPLTFSDDRSAKIYNFDRSTHGTQPLRRAFAGSLNIPAVKVETAVGISNVVDFMRNLGVYPCIPQADGKLDCAAPSTAYSYSLTLGGYPITMLQEAAGIAAIANLGVYHEPEFILSVKDNTGQSLYETNPDARKRQAVDPGVAFIVSEMLVDDYNRCYIFGCGSPLHMNDRRAAAKTGTSENYKDAWTAGWTPDLATVVYIGDIGPIDQVLGGAQADAVFTAAPIWNRYMTEALKGVPDNWYTPPLNVKQTGYGSHSWVLLDAQRIDRLPNDESALKPKDEKYWREHPLKDTPPDPGTGPIMVAVSPTPPGH